ncbi:MAG: HNH endonuclease [Lachnospiraceae bacterium]|nr:HNH endonuclease [Lachnospiraceae bacterium]
MIQYVLYKEESKKFIAYSDSRKVIHVKSLEEAHRFDTPNQARKAREKAPKKAAYFRVYIVMDNGELVKENSTITKRKKFSQMERKRIYQKTKGHCYLCGEFVDFDVFQVEHRIPLAKGGTNDFSNLFPACNCCNSMKNSIYPEELLEKITQIFMYQVTKRGNNHTKCVVAKQVITSMMEKNVLDRAKLQIACGLIESVE